MCFFCVVLFFCCRFRRVDLNVLCFLCCFIVINCINSFFMMSVFIMYIFISVLCVCVFFFVLFFYC